MEETQITNEEKDTIPKAEEKDEPLDLIEAAREKHWENNTQKSERISDIFVIQLILCILIVLIFAVINFFNSSVTEQYINEFKRMSAGEPEQIIKDAVKFVTDLIN